MRLKKSAYALLLGGGLSVLNIGCAAVDALVSSPAGYSASSGSPQRVAAIGRVFENQGRYTQARAMYRQALRNDPSNSTARDRLQYLASHQSDTKRQSADAAIAIADMVAPRKPAKSQTKLRQTVNQTIGSSDSEDVTAIQMVRAFEPSGQVESASLTVGGEFEDVTADQPTASLDVEYSNKAQVRSVEVASDTTGLVSFANDSASETHWADSVSEDIDVVSRQDAFDNVDGDGFIPLSDSAHNDTHSDQGTLFPEDTETGSVGFWRPARSNVSLTEVLMWSEAPRQNSDQLVLAIQQGQDEGVRALAVALLGEIKQADATIITALKQAAASGTPIVKAAALDALVIQGESDSESLDGLLALLAGDDSNVRTQSAATLLRMADTEWCDDAIAGLHTMLNDRNDEVVAVAATSLSEFGAAAVPCRVRLTEIAATTSSEMVLEATSMALSRIPRSDR